MMSLIKNALLIFIVALLSFPTLEKLFNLIPLNTFLEGYFEPSPRPEFTLDAFRSGEYQAKMTPHLERTIGFRVEFVRIYNQCDYSFFSIPHAARIIIGNDG